MNGRTNSAPADDRTIDIPLASPSEFIADPGDKTVLLNWTDPPDRYATSEGNVAQSTDQLISQWEYTAVVRKLGGYSSSPSDGSLVTKSLVHNQYKTNPYTDSNLINDTDYYYSAYAINTDGVPSEPARLIAHPTNGTPLSQLSEGTYIKLMENNKLHDFIVAKQNYQSDLNGDGYTLLVRRGILPDIYEYGITHYRGYDVSDLHRFTLNDTYFSQLSQFLQSQIPSIKIYAVIYTYEDTGLGHLAVKPIQTKIFTPSNTEFGSTVTGSKFPIEGSKLPTASQIVKDAGYNNTTIASANQKWVWTRSLPIPTSTNTDAYIISIDANFSGFAIDERTSGEDHWVIPCFVLPNTLRVDHDNILIEE